MCFFATGSDFQFLYSSRPRHPSHCVGLSDPADPLSSHTGAPRYLSQPKALAVLCRMLWASSITTRANDILNFRRLENPFPNRSSLQPSMVKPILLSHADSCSASHISLPFNFTILETPELARQLAEITWKLETKNTVRDISSNSRSDLAVNLAQGEW